MRGQLYEKMLFFIIIAFAILFVPTIAQASLTSGEDDAPQVYYYKAEVLRVETITSSRMHHWRSIRSDRSMKL